MSIGFPNPYAGGYKSDNPRDDVRPNIYTPSNNERRTSAAINYAQGKFAPGQPVLHSQKFAIAERLRDHYRR